MMRTVFRVALATSLLGPLTPLDPLNWMAVAEAQVEGTGRATGTVVELLDSAELVRNADTGEQNAPPNFNVTVPGVTVDLAPVAQVVSDGSTTVGTVDDAAGAANTSSVQSSTSGNTVRLLVEQAPDADGDGVQEDVLAIVESSASASVSCATLPMTSSNVDLITIAGTPVDLPEDDQTETVILADELDLLRLNVSRREIEFDPATGGVRATASAQGVVAEVVTGLLVLEATISDAFAELTGLPFDCPAFAGGPGGPFLDVDKTASFVTDTGTPNFADPGDRITFRIDAVNTTNVGGSAAGSGITVRNVTIVDRIPDDVTVVDGSFALTVNGVPVASPSVTVGACPAGINFASTTCGPSQSASPQCISVPVGDLGPGQSASFRFDVTVDADIDADICNVAFAGPFPGTVIVDGPNPTPTPTPTRTGASVAATPTRTRTDDGNGGGATRTPTPGGPGGGTATPVRTATRDDRLVLTGGGGCSIGGSDSASEMSAVMMLLALLALRRRKASR